MNANILNDDEFAAAFIRVKATIGQKRSGITGRASFGAVEPVADGAIDVTENTLGDPDFAKAVRDARDRIAKERKA